MSKTPPNKKQPKRPRRPRREYGIGDFLGYISGPTGLVAAVKKVAAEEKTMAGPLATEIIQ